MKNTYKHIILDLDGTITDSEEGITKSVEYALNKFGIAVSDRTKLTSFIGPPLLDGFQTLYKFSLSDALIARKYYRDYYKEKGVFECELYEGIPDLLKTLKDSSKKIYLATSKPHIYAKMILEHYNIDSYFDKIYGAEAEEKFHDKAEYIEDIIQGNPGEQLSSFVMIGDRMYDIIAAKKNKIDSIGVTFGFGTLSELKAYDATHILNSVSELKDFLD